MLHEIDRSHITTTVAELPVAATRLTEIAAPAEYPMALTYVRAAYEVHPQNFDLPLELTPRIIERLKITDTYLQRLIAMPASALDPSIPDDSGRNALDVIRDDESDASAHARRRETRGKWNRRPGTAYQDEHGNMRTKQRDEWGDPVTSADFFESKERGVGDPALAAWRENVPRAVALSYLTSAFEVTHVTRPNGEVVEATDITRYWLAGCTDAEAIRNRGAGLNRMVADFMCDYGRKFGSEQLSIMSVACGTAIPTLQAATEVGAADAKLTLLDIDTEAMDLTRTFAENMGFNGDIITQRKNIFSARVLAGIKERLTADGVDNRPHIVDAMGIFEYTGNEFIPEGKTEKDSLMYDPAGFLEAIYDLVRPGGRLVFGQMRDDRPNADFTMGVVRWPYVSMRSPKEVMEVIQKAGISPNQVKLGLTPEGVYTIASIDKPEEHRSLVAVGSDFSVARSPEAARRARYNLHTATAAGAAVAGTFVQCAMLASRTHAA